MTLTERTDRLDEQRRSAKAINFGLIYGMSAFGLDRIRKDAHDKGYVETLFGRRLYLPEIDARNAQRRAAAGRTVINAPMQGTASDIIKRAMLAVDKR